MRFGRKKELALLCYLAAKWGMHPRNELAESLWPERRGAARPCGLRAVLHKLRKNLEGRRAHDEWPALRHRKQRSGTRAREIELDLEVFEAAVSLSAAGRRRRELIGRCTELLGL